jgi:fructokinase
LHRADAVKLNIHELRELSGLLFNQPGNESMGIRLLQDRYGLKDIIVTKGAQGASYYTPQARHDCAAMPVVVKDTVGSGDSFLAGFLRRHTSRCLPTLFANGPGPVYRGESLEAT